MTKITGGQWRGQNLKTPDHRKTRPTSAKVREAIFSSLYGKIEEARVLDLFAGSGALGFDALSRGAVSLVAVEASASAAKIIRDNAQTLKASSVEVVQAKVEKAIPHLIEAGPFNLCFADPPYADSWMTRLEEMPWDELLATGATLVVEWGGPAATLPLQTLPDQVGPLEKTREKSYGETRVTHFQKK